MRTALFLLLFSLSYNSVWAERCDIVYGMRSDPYKPYEWRDSNGKFHGMNLDLLEALAKEADCGYSVIMGDRVELLDMLKNGDITMLSMSPSAAVDQFAVYIQQAIVLNRYVVNRMEDPYIDNMEDWRGKTILIVSDSYTESYLEAMAEEYELTILRFRAHDEMAGALVNGTGDFMITSLPVIMNLPESYSVKINGYPLMSSVYGFALRKTDPLYPKLSAAMESLKTSGKYFDILKKWSRPREPAPRWYRYIPPVLGALVIAVSAVLLWNQSLHMRVQKKTASLNSLTRLLQMLLDVLPERIYLLNNTGKPVWSNANSASSAFSIDLIKTEIEQAITTSSSFEIRRYLDNREIWAVSGIILEKWDDPLLLVASNITESVRQMDESLTIDRMTALGNMAANIAHEINNPAGLIMHNIGFLQKLSRDIHALAATPGEDKRFAGLSWREAAEEERSAHTIIAESVRRIIDTIEDLKQFSKKRDEAYAGVDLKVILHNSMRFISYFVKSYTAKFSCHVNEPVPAVCGHAQHIEQVIINLVQNACYALTDRSQAVKCALGASEDGRYAALSVEDEGSGMSESVRKKAFEAFFTTRENGTGLGLSIVASIVKEHRGYYTVESEVGKGTRITVFFPREDI